MNYLDQLAQQVKSKNTDTMNRERPSKSPGEPVSMATRMAVIRAQLNARLFMDNQIKPHQKMVDNCEKAEVHLYKLAQEGAPEAEEMLQANNQNRWDALRALKMNWPTFFMKKDGFLAEGVTRGEASRGMGWMCAQLQAMQGVATFIEDGKRKLKWDTVTVDHLKEIKKALVAEKDHMANIDPQGCPEYTAKIDSQEELTVTQGMGRVIGDATEADTDDLLTEEYRKMDELAARRRPVIIRKAN